MKRIKNELIELKLLLKSVPILLMVFFYMVVFAMNILANKSIDLGVSWLALDTGIIISWGSFLAMDIIVKHFGPKAATELSILAIFFNLFFSLIFFLASLIPGTWGEAYIPGSENIINNALNNTIGSTWYVILGSTCAFLVASFVNNFSNYGLGLLFRKNPDSKASYFIRSYTSTLLGQFVDNFLFALIVSHVFFGWTMLQCVMCSFTGMLVELLCEAIFSYFGYKITAKMKLNNVGKEYFEFKKSLKEGK